MINISASLVKDYLSCQRKGYYRINYPELSISTDDMVIGEVLHKVIEKCWDKGKLAATKYSNDLLNKYNILDPSVKKLSKISRSINNFFSNFFYLCSDDDDIEKFFKIPYSDDVFIVGKMDRVTKNGYIYDWKSSLSTPKSIDNDIQFIMYYVSYKSIYKKNPKKVFYASLTNGKLVEFNPKSYYVDTLYNNIIPSLVDDIKRGKFDKTGLYNNSCLTCQFQINCWK